MEAKVKAQLTYFKHNDISMIMIGNLRIDVVDNDLAKKITESFNNYEAVKSSLTDLFNIMEITNPGFKKGNSIYDRAKALTGTEI